MSDSFFVIWLIGYRALGTTTVQSRCKKVDAQASSERTGIGGWFPHRGQDGKIDVRGSRWFSLELNEEEWLWVYARGRKPALIISTLESLSVLVALKLHYGATPLGETHESSDSADDHGQPWERCSSQQIDEHQIHSFRSAHGTGVIHAKDEHKEADRLAHGNAEDFDPSLRIDVSASTLSWDILPEALEAGGAAERQSQEARERGTLPDRCRKGKRRRPEERLRLKDPW